MTARAGCHGRITGYLARVVWRDHRSLAYAVSGGQVLGSGASKGQQPIDDRGLVPPPVIYGEPLPLFDTNRGADSSPRDTYGLGGRPALWDPCRPRGCGLPRASLLGPRAKWFWQHRHFDGKRCAGIHALERRSLPNRDAAQACRRWWPIGVRRYRRPRCAWGRAPPRPIRRGRNRNGSRRWRARGSRRAGSPNWFARAAWWYQRRGSAISTVAFFCLRRMWRIGQATSAARGSHRWPRALKCVPMGSLTMTAARKSPLLRGSPVKHENLKAAVGIELDIAAPGAHCSRRTSSRSHSIAWGCFERLADQSWTGDLPLRARWRDQHARYMAAFGTFVRDQPILVGHWSDGHHIFHGSPAFGARRNCVLASGSWFRCHNTRPLLVLPILEQRRTCSLVRRKGQSTLGERDRSSARTARFS